VIQEAPERLVLALETTAPHPGVALARARGADVRLLAEHAIAADSRRAEGLAQCVRRVLDDAGAKIEQVAALAVVDGPGSYTALRVGLALARGLSLIDQSPVTVIGALELVAHGDAAGDGRAENARICAVLDAGSAKVYAAGFEAIGGELRESRPALEIPDTELPGLLREWGGAWELRGDAALASRLALDGTVAPLRAGVLALLGARRLIAGRADAVERVVPRYVGTTGARPNLPVLGEGRPVLR